MSIASQIARLQGVKADILQAISDKGVTVPAGSALDDCPGLIGNIGEHPYGSVTIGGRSYKTIVMPDGKEWLAENLDYKWTGLVIGPSGNPSTQAAWYYNNDEATYGIDGTFKCGLLYNWYAVDYLETNKAALIPGWHVPSSNEWDLLATHVKVLSMAGAMLKSIDNSIISGFPSGWQGIDDYNFSVIPCGTRDDTFVNLNTYCVFWTSTEYDSSNANRRYFSSNNSMSSDYLYKSFGNSLRLVRDT